MLVFMILNSVQITEQLLLPRTAGNTLLRIILERIRVKTKQTTDEQARKGTRDQIMNLRILMYKAPATTLNVLCGLRAGIQLDLP